LSLIININRAHNETYIVQIKNTEFEVEKGLLTFTLQIFLGGNGWLFIDRDYAVSSKDLRSLVHNFSNCDRRKIKKILKSFKTDLKLFQNILPGHLKTILSPIKTNTRFFSQLYFCRLD